MQLSDLENVVLLQMQQNNFAFGSTPSYATNADYPQTLVDFAINRGYTAVVARLGDLDILSNAITFATVSQQYLYPVVSGANVIGARAVGAVTVNSVPASGTITVTVNGTPVVLTITSTLTSTTSIAAALQTALNASSLVTGSTIAPVQVTPTNLNQVTIYANTAGTAGNAITLAATASLGASYVTASGATLSGGTAASAPARIWQRLQYQPLGLTYALNYEPGEGWLTWDKFQDYSAYGYLQPFSFALQPDVVTLTPDEQNLQFYPGPFTNGDLVTVKYSPQISQNAAVPASAWGKLVNATDTPMPQLPEDMHDLIWMWAVSFLWPRAREVGTGKLWSEVFASEFERMRQDYQRSAYAEVKTLRPRSGLTNAGWLGG